MQDFSVRECYSPQLTVRLHERATRSLNLGLTCFWIHAPDMEVRVDFVNASSHPQHRVVDFLESSQTAVTATHKILKPTVFCELPDERLLLLRRTKHGDRV